MKEYYYNLDDAEFFDASGEKIPRCVPELSYQERALWKIFLRDRNNSNCDFAGIAAWSAAVDCDFSSTSAPMCRSVDAEIAADPDAGSVTIRLDANTAEFLAAVDGSSGRPAYFELCGFDAEGGRRLYLCFEICARMSLDPDPAVPPEVVDTVATKTYTALAVSAALGSAHADAVAVAARQCSGAIVSGAAFTTTVGPYTVALTSGGGLRVTGSNGESMVISGGTATLAGGDEANVTAASHVGICAPTEVAISAGAVPLSGHVTVNGAPAATRIVTSTDTVTTSAAIPVLSGGVAYIYTQPLTSLSVANVANAPAEDYIRFTLASGGSVSIPASVAVLNSGLEFEGGKEYLIAFNGGMMVAAEVTPGA